MHESFNEHLLMVQSIIDRMAQCSFQLKSWAITLAFALAAFLTNEVAQTCLSVPSLPVIAFWLLDAWYLRQERLFRRLYDDVRKRQSNADFSMDVSAFRDSVPSLLATAASPTILGFYGPLVVAIATLAFSLPRP
jgi:hypothetical protein